MSIFQQIEEEGDEIDDKFLIIEEVSLEGVLSINKKSPPI